MKPMFSRLKAEIVSDIEGFIRRDPAARNAWEVLLCYPGFHALMWHRLAHFLWQRGFKLLARMLSQLARFLTGIEIHPAAVIGQALVIDHGEGVVIGETSRIGDRVTIYQHVTLGGTTMEKGHRHPYIGDDAIIGAGAKILGPITVGTGARIGANAVVTRDVALGETMVGVPARPVILRRAIPESFTAYGTPCDERADPLAAEIRELRATMQTLQARLEQLEEAVPVQGQPAVTAAREGNWT